MSSDAWLCGRSCAEGLPVPGDGHGGDADGGEAYEQNRREKGSATARLADTVTLHRAPASIDAFS
jgi:hypothetical protein